MTRAVRRMFESGQIIAGKWFGKPPKGGTGGGPGGDALQIGELNRQLLGYPKNHNFQIRDGRRIPSHRLAERWRKINGLE